MYFDGRERVVREEKQGITKEGIVGVVRDICWTKGEMEGEATTAGRDEAMEGALRGEGRKGSSVAWVG